MNSKQLEKDIFIEKCREVFLGRASKHGMSRLKFPEIKQNQGIAAEGFRIDPGKVEIGSSSALYATLGKYLRTAGACSTEENPAKPFRAIYYPTHFNNFYHRAPLEVIREYTEDMALLGYNYIAMTVAISQLKGENDTETAPHVERIRRMFEIVRNCGMKTILMVLANDGFADTPKEFRATNTKRAFFGCEICPSVIGGMNRILDNHRLQASWFENIDAVLFWPYDEGGCGCDKCAPWGGHAMFEVCRRASEIYRERFPPCKIIYSTWCFNYQGEKELKTLYARLDKGEGDWIDYVLSDGHDEFNKWQLKNPLPGKPELINFPEISMWGRSPWGGFGATPLPERFVHLWGTVKDITAGGMLYSEGTYEDINKVIYAAFYWNGDTDWKTPLAEYCRYEFGIDDFSLFNELFLILERNHPGLIWSTTETHWQNGRPVEPKNWGRLKRKPDIWTDLARKNIDSDKAWTLVRGIQEIMPKWASESWRWRIIWIRARLDYLLNENSNEPDEECEALFCELVELYHLDIHNSYRATIPYTDQWLRLPKLNLREKSSSKTDGKVDWG